MAMTFRHPNLVSLGNDLLTDESRKPLVEERDERSVIVELASGKKKKFVKGVWRKWRIEWDNVAANANETVDGLAARDEIRALAEGAGYLTFKITDGRNAEETYTVSIESYEEEVLSRKGPGGFRYKLSLYLEEQGGGA